MSFDPDQFRRVIVYLLNVFSERCGRDVASPEAVELLMLTAAHESHLGRYLHQVGLSPVQGGACGVYQMEPKTHDDVQERRVVERYPFVPLSDFRRMVWDLQYATWMARIYYLQFPESIPPANEIAELAHYYKKYWNTPAGKARHWDIVGNYFRYVREE